MKSPADLLREILAAISPLLADSALNNQQLTFIQHIHKTAAALLDQVDDIPAGELALRRILPVIAEPIEQPLVALYGYARMLLDYPASFGGAVVADSERTVLEQVYANGTAIAHMIEQMRQDSFQERSAARKAPATAFDMGELIAAHLPIYRYWLKKRAVRLSVHVAPDLVPVYASRYHSAELLGHTVQIIGRELIEYGQISLDIALRTAAVEVAITCPALRLLEAEWQILFRKDSRHLYLQQAEKYGIRWRVDRPAGMGAVLYFSFPLAAP